MVNLPGLVMSFVDDNRRLPGENPVRIDVLHRTNQGTPLRQGRLTMGGSDSPLALILALGTPLYMIWSIAPCCQSKMPMHSFGNRQDGLFDKGIFQIRCIVKRILWHHGARDNKTNTIEITFEKRISPSICTLTGGFRLVSVWSTVKTQSDQNVTAQG